MKTPGFFSWNHLEHFFKSFFSWNQIQSEVSCYFTIDAIISGNILREINLDNFRSLKMAIFAVLLDFEFWF